MSQISRNAPCPCGSGKKYKRCCGSKKATNSHDLPAGIRMKGGIIFDEELNAYVPIVHSWDNIDCIGEPKEWRSQEIFSNENDAMNFYKAKIRPSLQRIMSKIEKESSETKVKHNKLE